MQHTMKFREENQLNEVADEVSALFAVVRPILAGTLFALKRSVVRELGGHKKLKLHMLPRAYRRGDGDCGICFEWAVHDAILREDQSIMDRIETALKKCNVKGSDCSSILFGAEKDGAVQLIETADEILTEDSRLLAGTRGQPVKLKKHINMVASAFRRPNARLALPYSISGLWKADLFLGKTDSDRWVGTSVKINRMKLESARGLRVGVVPMSQGASDRVAHDERKNLVICPLPYDDSFMEIFYRGWNVVQQFLTADAKMPHEATLPRPPDRYVAKELFVRRNFPVVQVIDALDTMAQPGLLGLTEKSVHVVLRGGDKTTTGAVVAPVGRKH